VENRGELAAAQSMVPTSVRREDAASSSGPGMIVTVDIELLMVPDCPHRRAAVELLHTALADTRITASVTTTIVATLDEARRRGFVGSPTILIDGRDPFADPGAQVAVACRIYSTPDGIAGLPSLRDLRQALKRAAERG
jgi:hypothetical protein